VQAVRPAAIVSAQQKFIRPALGPLYDSLLDGLFPDLTDSYIKPALALYVKWLLLPSLAVRSGPMGVVRHTTANAQPADPKAIAAARRRVKADATALMCCAVEHIAANPVLYSGFEPAEGPKARGGMII
ncbi:MAG: hypothetical protein LBU95_06115, partial [Rikenellaceae bacterium]|jgi:hypothetical protein|nr:hypothetical protein [Rikenellaceae bacterium]